MKQEWPADRVERRLTSSLVPYARNARTHSEAQVAQIAASVTEWGWTVPVLVDEAGVIIAGHGRVLAALLLGLDEVPVMVAAGWTEAQRRAYVLADNRLAMNAGWDTDLLKLEVADLKVAEFDLSLAGFGADELAALMAEKTVGLTDEDAIPDAPADPVTVPGDVWLLGRHRVMCGDSTSIDSVNDLLCGEKAQMVHTDPPYGVSYQSNMRTKSAKFAVLQNDDGFLDIAPVIDSCADGWVFVWTSWKVLPNWLDQFASFGFPTNQVIWHKPGGGIGDLKKTFASDYETALVWNRGAALTGKRIGSVWKVSKDGAGTYLHPTQKPVALAEEAIDKTTRPGFLVLDLFGGSGSTLIACEKTGRDARLMELEPRFCDVIVNRWQGFTGRQATLEGDGRTFEEVSCERTKAEAVASAAA